VRVQIGDRRIGLVGAGISSTGTGMVGLGPSGTAINCLVPVAGRYSASDPADGGVFICVVSGSSRTLHFGQNSINVLAKRATFERNVQPTSCQGGSCTDMQCSYMQKKSKKRAIPKAQRGCLPAQEPRTAEKSRMLRFLRSLGVGGSHD